MRASREIHTRTQNLYDTHTENFILAILTFSKKVFFFDFHFFSLKCCFGVFIPLLLRARNNAKHPENTPSSLRNETKRVCGGVVTGAIAAHNEASQPPKHTQTARKSDLRSGSELQVARGSCGAKAPRRRAPFCVLCVTAGGGVCPSDNVVAPQNNAGARYFQGGKFGGGCASARGCPCHSLR